RPLRRRDGRQRRDVARAIHHRRLEPAPGLHALVVGHLPRHALGLGDVPRNDRVLPVPDAPLHPVPPDDLDLRDEDARAGGRRRAGEGPGRLAMKAKPAAKPPIYGYLAEFEEPAALLVAARKVKAEGYEVVEAYSPLPLHGLAEILGWRNRLPAIVF